MKILITGSSGFLGKIIKANLKDYFVCELNRNSGDYRYSLEKEIPKFDNNFDLVVHAAGKAHSIPKTEIEINEFYQVNVEGTQNLLKGLEENKLPMYFVFISSVSVYGADVGKLINEETELLAKDPYGLSKIKSELLVKEWCKSNNIVCTILRLPLLVGENAPGNLGAMIKSIKKGYYFNIGGGKAKKSMVLAKDVANVISIVAPIGGIYNLTDGFHPKFKDLSTIIALKNKKSKPKNIPLNMAKFLGRIGDLIGVNALVNSSKVKKITSDLTFDDSKARTILKWNPESVLDYINRNSI